MASFQTREANWLVERMWRESNHIHSTQRKRPLLTTQRKKHTFYAEKETFYAEKETFYAEKEYILRKERNTFYAEKETYILRRERIHSTQRKKHTF